MRGRKPLPDRIKQLKGTLRPHRINGDAPTPPPGMPAMPFWLSKKGQPFWKQYAEEFHDMGILTTMDQAAFGCLCEIISTIKAMNKILDQDGILIYEGSVPKKHPAFGILKDAWAQLRAFAVEFGMTPSSRSRVSVEKPKTLTKFQEFLEKANKRD